MSARFEVGGLAIMTEWGKDHVVRLVEQIGDPSDELFEVRLEDGSYINAAPDPTWGNLRPLEIEYQS